ncbi:glycosyltransferase [Corynebacterium sp. P5848]|uniref:glycosyltransferase n=1 Tax=Corynebacterium marambiense TaxID=2765364 RepID=UPI0022608F46|nr:glycosyltransferase [Corynebacterium marambiense]MCX7542626.1 glycosyltransferase [Corynebacterium marambiense]
MLPSYSPHRTLSVVIPCLNDAGLLTRCLRALLHQTVPASEIIVVDNGSIDDSAVVARGHGARVVDEPRRGITWATRTGFDTATSDVMLRTDTDVAPAPDFLERLHRAWDLAEDQMRSGASRRRIVGVTGSGRFELPGWRGSLASAAYLGAYRASVGSALGHQPFFGTNYCIRRDWWLKIRDEVDMSDTEVHEDMHLSFAVHPDETVWLQSDLTLAMDARAVEPGPQMLRRFRRGFHTIAVNWRREKPWHRLDSRGLLPTLHPSKDTLS